MMIVMLLLRAWIIEMRETSVKPRDLADDLLMIASGTNHGDKITEAVEKAYDYMNDMGATIAAKKSILFSSCTATRKKLRHHRWKCGDRIPVVSHARDLGAHLAISNRAYATTLRTRVKSATTLVEKIGRLPVTYKNKTHHIRTKALTKAEKDERNKAKAVDKQLLGYGPEKWVETDLRLDRSLQERRVFSPLELQPPVQGVHRFDV